MAAATTKILTIEDKGLSTELDRAGYKKLGVTYKVVHSFKDAEEYLTKDTFDVIVVNYDYNRLDHMSICRHFKAQPHTKDLPIVFTSVQDKPKNLPDFVQAGLDLFIQLPIPRQFFIERLRTLLEQKVRETERVVHEGDVEFTYQESQHLCPIGDLSKSGILLSTQLTMKPGSLIELSFVVPGYKKPIRITGEVVRSITKGQDRPKEQLGIGVRFKHFHGDSKKRLESYIEKFQIDDPKMAYYL